MCSPWHLRSLEARAFGEAATLRRPRPGMAFALHGGGDPVPVLPSGRVPNVLTLGRHFGDGFNAPCGWLCAELLAQPEGEWQPFVPPPSLARLYRTNS